MLKRLTERLDDFVDDTCLFSERALKAEFHLQSDEIKRKHTMKITADTKKTWRKTLFVYVPTYLV